jgi:hypothetical protein
MPVDKSPHQNAERIYNVNSSTHPSKSSQKVHVRQTSGNKSATNTIYPEIDVNQFMQNLVALHYPEISSKIPINLNQYPARTKIHSDALQNKQSRDHEPKDLHKQLNIYKAKHAQNKHKLEKQELKIENLQNELRHFSELTYPREINKFDRTVQKGSFDQDASSRNDRGLNISTHPQYSDYLSPRNVQVSAEEPSSAARLTIRTSFNPLENPIKLKEKQKLIAALESELAVEKERRRSAEIKNLELKDRINRYKDRKESHTRSLNDMLGEIRHALYSS